MTDRELDIDHFRARLQEERARVIEAIQNLRGESPVSLEEETGEETTFDNHLADAATVTYHRELDYTLEGSEQTLLARIDRALERIEEGTFGRCERCGKEIAVERLEARPWAELDIDCQRELERAGAA
jgi:RNA polymerase-binding protein DksA